MKNAKYFNLNLSLQNLNILKFGFLFFLVFLCCNCEDVIEVDLNEAEPRLVVEASINWFKNTPGNNQSVKLSLSAPFFDDTIPPANGATVTIINTSNGIEYVFIEDGTTGIYETNNFVPVINQEYRLTINYDIQYFVATEI